MEKEMYLFRKLGKFGFYLILIFCVLALINWGNKRMMQQESATVKIHDQPSWIEREL